MLSAIPIGDITPQIPTVEEAVYPLTEYDYRSFVGFGFLSIEDGVIEVVDNYIGVSKAGTNDASPLLDVFANLEIVDAGNGLYRDVATGYLVFFGRDYARENQRDWCEPLTVNQDRIDEDGNVRSDVCSVRDF